MKCENAQPVLLAPERSLTLQYKFLGGLCHGIREITEGKKGLGKARMENLPLQRKEE